MRSKSFKACCLHNPWSHQRDWLSGRHCKDNFHSHFNWSSPASTQLLSFYSIVLNWNSWCMLVSGVHRIIWHLHTLWSDHHANSTNHLSPSKVGTLLTTFLMLQGFPGGWDGKESACNVGDLGLIPGSERSLGEGNGNPSQYSCLENSMDRGTWRAIVHGIAESGMNEWPLSLSYAVHYILVTYLLYNWRFISLNPLYLFHPLPPSFWQPVFSSAGSSVPPFWGHVAHRIPVPDQDGSCAPGSGSMES